MSQFLRRFFRKNLAPVPQEAAASWKQKLSIAYAFISTNALILIVYVSLYDGKADLAEYYGLKTDKQLKQSSAYQWADTFKMKNVKVYRINGFSLEEQVDPTKHIKTERGEFPPPELD